jgi:hypothetical protein
MEGMGNQSRYGEASQRTCSVQLNFAVRKEYSTAHFQPRPQEHGKGPGQVVEVSTAVER